MDAAMMRRLWLTNRYAMRAPMRHLGVATLRNCRCHRGFRAIAHRCPPRVAQLMPMGTGTDEPVSLALAGSFQRSVNALCLLQKLPIGQLVVRLVIEARVRLEVGCELGAIGDPDALRDQRIGAARRAEA